MRSISKHAVSIAFSGADAQARPPRADSTRLLVVPAGRSKLNALYATHPAFRANHGQGAVFEGMFSRHKAPNALSSADLS